MGEASDNKQQWSDMCDEDGDAADFVGTGWGSSISGSSGSDNKEVSESAFGQSWYSERVDEHAALGNGGTMSNPGVVCNGQFMPVPAMGMLQGAALYEAKALQQSAKAAWEQSTVTQRERVYLDVDTMAGQQTAAGAPGKGQWEVQRQQWRQR